MKTKDEIKNWLLENCIDSFGNLDLSELDFSDFEKLKGNLYQDYQEVKGSLYQNGQKVSGDLWQDCQKVEGTIFQDNITNADIDEKINELKEIISKLEKQKINEEEKIKTMELYVYDLIMFRDKKSTSISLETIQTIRNIKDVHICETNNFRFDESNLKILNEPFDCFNWYNENIEIVGIWSFNKQTKNYEVIYYEY